MEKGRIEFNDPAFRPLPKANKRGIRYQDHTSEELHVHFTSQNRAAGRRATQKRQDMKAILRDILPYIEKLPPDAFGVDTADEGTSCYKRDLFIQRIKGVI